MKIGIKKERYSDLTEISNILKLNEQNCNIKSADFKSCISAVTRPCIDNKFIPLHFELRGNYEIIAIGSIEDISSFFKLSIVDKNEHEYLLGIKKDEDGEIKRNPKSYKFFANVCNYDSKVTSKLKRDYFCLSNEENLYFYRTGIKLLTEQETIDELVNKKHFNNFSKTAIHTIRKQVKYHKMFNLPYKLDIKAITIEDSPKYENETSLSFIVESDKPILLKGTYDHINKFVEPIYNYISLNITDKENSDINKSIFSEGKMNIKNIFLNTIKGNNPLISLK